MDKSHYKSYRIRKSGGGFREILEPEPELKAKQRAILKWLMARQIHPSPYAHGFIKRRSIVTNARSHTGKRVIVKIDIKDFFPGITSRQIVYALGKEGVSREDAEQITEICTVDDRLPQGSPTSPFLSNVVFKSADYRLAGLAKSWDAAYSRYADDLCFSGDNERLNAIYHPVRKILEDEGFTINDKKFRVIRNSSRQIVAGVVVNKKPNILREERRKLRACLHNLKKAILAGEVPQIDFTHLAGKASHYKAVNPVLGQKLIQEIRQVAELLRLRQLLSV